MNFIVELTQSNIITKILIYFNFQSYVMDNWFMNY